MPGELYLEVYDLQKEAQKKVVWYKHPRKLHHILIHEAQVFITNIVLDADSSIDINEYQTHSDCCHFIYFIVPSVIMKT